jgi:hypothetical protein
MTNLFSQTFAKDRTESDILAHEPIKLRLGKKSTEPDAEPVEYAAAPLPLRKGKEWRQKVADVLNELAKGMMGQVATSDNIMQGLMVAFFAFPDKVLELLIAYAPDALEPHRELMMETATDEEVVIALSRVLVVAYPYFSLLGTMKTAAMATSPATSHP